ncbi:MAG: aminoglycoside phosphotransferase family protein [Oscillospiraceae bacterium]|nr:aminoglycoside phosphotransferase family protein [Oscillospiraceae bacterium]
MNELQTFAANKWGTQPAEGSAADGYSSAVAFAVHPMHGTVVLKRPKVHNMYLAERDTLQLLEQNSFPAPRLLACDDESGTMMLSRLSGENLANRKEQPSCELAANLGILLAMFHKIPAPKTFVKESSAEHIQATFNRDINFLQDHLDETLLQKVQQFAQEGFTAIKQNNFSCLTHNDFRLGNVLAQEKSLYLLDFESCALGDRYCDFGKILTQDLPPELHTVFLQAYAEN